MMHLAWRSAALVFAAAAMVGVTVLTGCSGAPSTRPARAAPAAASPGGWGTAQTVPGTAALNQDGSAGINSVSCASAGNCSAGGDYLPASAFPHAFVVSEVNGTWQRAEAVPGIATLSQGGHGSPPQAVINSMSCAPAGNCSAGGYYTDRFGDNQA